MFKAFERRLSIVPRWTIVPTLFKQNVAEHSFYVALYADKLCYMLEVPDEERARVVGYALRHDMSEVMHGDAPGPSKDRLWDEHKAEREEETLCRAGDSDYPTKFSCVSEEIRSWNIVKMADKIEAAMFLNREVATGNVAVEHILASHVRWINENGPPLGLSRKHISQIIGAINNSAKVSLPL
jgi:5'-deoxynucleotidase